MGSKKQLSRFISATFLAVLVVNILLPVVQGQGLYETDIFIGTELSFLEKRGADYYFVYEDTVGFFNQDFYSVDFSYSSWDFTNLADFEADEDASIFLLFSDELTAGVIWQDGEWWDYNETAQIPVGAASCCKLWGDYLIVKNSTHLIQYDVSDLEAITEIDRLPMEGSEFVVVDSGWLYVLSGDTIKVVETAPTGLNELGSFPMSIDSPIAIYLFEGDTLVVSSGQLGSEIELVDLSDSPTLSQLAVYDGHASEYMYGYGGHLYLGIANKIVILNLENPEKPKMTTEFTNDWEDEFAYYLDPITGDITNMWGDGSDLIWAQEGFTFIKNFGEIIKEGDKFTLGIAPWAAGTIISFFSIIVYFFIDKLIVRKIVRG